MRSRLVALGGVGLRFARAGLALAEGRQRGREAVELPPQLPAEANLVEQTTLDTNSAESKSRIGRANAEAEVARIQSLSLTPQYMRYRELQIMEKLAESQNKVFVPSSMLDSMAGQIQLGRQ